MKRNVLWEVASMPPWQRYVVPSDAEGTVSTRSVPAVIGEPHPRRRAETAHVQRIFTRSHRTALMMPRNLQQLPPTDVPNVKLPSRAPWSRGSKRKRV